MSQLVAAAGYHVDVVTDLVNSNYSLSNTSALDVLLCELDLKGVPWGEARRTLSEMNIEVPAIMFSDTAELDKMMRALRLGASDFFVRPVEDFEALGKSIDRCIRERRMRRELQDSRRRLELANTELRGTIQLSQVGTEALPGAVFIGRNSGDFLGAGLGEQGDRAHGIAGAGDVDGDGRADILIGSVAATTRGGRVRAGETYLLYGQGD